jgi:hypothetical protein
MDTYVCFGENLKAHRSEAVLSSVNAPGADQLPWDREACTVAGEHRHSGELGCQVEAGQALLWNESAVIPQSGQRTSNPARGGFSAARTWSMLRALSKSLRGEAVTLRTWRFQVVTIVAARFEPLSSGKQVSPSHLNSSSVCALQGVPG